jgi:hypothetical protein
VSLTAGSVPDGIPSLPAPSYLDSHPAREELRAAMEGDAVDHESAGCRRPGACHWTSTAANRSRRRCPWRRGGAYRPGGVYSGLRPDAMASTSSTVINGTVVIETRPLDETVMANVAAALLSGRSQIT